MADEHAAARADDPQAVIAEALARLQAEGFQYCCETLREAGLTYAVLDWFLRRLQNAETALREIVEFSLRDDRTAGWHFAEVRAIARAALAAAGTGEA